MADGGTKGKTALPEHFHVTDPMRAWARANCPNVDVIAATAEMIDYCRARDWRMKDWEATWRNWMRKATKSSVGRNHFAAPVAPVQAKPQEEAPKTFPQPCVHKATLNRIMFRILMDRRGVPIEALREAVRERNLIARELREMHGDRMPDGDWQELLPGIVKRLKEVMA